MNKHAYITMQEVRRDVPGFLKRVAAGERLTVVYHSKPLVEVSGSPVEQSQESARANMREFLAIAAQARASAQCHLDPNKSYKELYTETMGKKYGIS